MKSKNIHTMKQPELGVKISELRKAKGLTQEELVEKCNLNVRTIQRIEAGEVTPRSYTIKAILGALDYDYKSIISIPENSKQSTILKFAWIAGIIFFIIGFFEIYAEYSRFEYNRIDYTNPFFERSEVTYTNPFYIIVKLVSLISFSVFIYGFVSIGDLFKNRFLKIVSFLLLVTYSLVITLDIISLYFNLIFLNITLVIEIISLGSIQLLFGISLLSLSKKIGNIALAAGVVEILTGILFISVIFVFAGLITYIPAIILEIVILYKTSEYLKNGKSDAG